MTPGWLLELSQSRLSLYASWLAAATQTSAREVENPNIPSQDFTLDALLTTTLPIYPGLRLAHSMLDCALCELVILTAV